MEKIYVHSFYSTNTVKQVISCPTLNMTEAGTVTKPLAPVRRGMRVKRLIARSSVLH